MYKEFYKLTGMPFQLTPDPTFFYASPGHKRVLSYLQYGVHQGDGFIVVTGDVGTGKTTLIRTLLSELEKEKSILAAQLVTTHLDTEDLLKMVSSAFNLEHEGLSKPSLLRNLEKFLKEQAANGKRVLLIVDESQNLPIKSLEELRMLSNFQDDSGALFQSFLVGQEEFRQVLKIDFLEQLRQRVVASYHLGPLNEDETDTYIKHRLATVGWKGDPAFTDESIAAIYAFTTGVPRRINTLCDRILLLASLQEDHTIDKKTVDLVTKELAEETGWTGDNENVVDVSNYKAISNSTSVGKLSELEKRVESLEKIIVNIRNAITPSGNRSSGKKKKSK